MKTETKIVEMNKWISNRHYISITLCEKKIFRFYSNHLCDILKIFWDDDISQKSESQKNVIANIISSEDKGKGSIDYVVVSSYVA